MPEGRLVTWFESIRFRLLITIAMRFVLVYDRVVMAQAGAKTCRVPNSTRRKLKSQSRTLEANLVAPRGAAVASVLILHGIGERLDYWQDAQNLLASHNIASIIVHYSGYGGSNGAVTPENLRADVISAYAALQGLAASKQPPFLLGLSLGTGIAVDAAPHLEPAPLGIILCEAFSSLREAAVSVCESLRTPSFVAKPLAKLMPDIYRTEATIRHTASPLLIVHSQADELFHPQMARHIFAAARQNPELQAELVILQNFSHNDAYLRPQSGYWNPILSFIAKRYAASN